MSGVSLVLHREKVLRPRTFLVTKKIPEVDEEELHLLPTKVYGFNLGTKESGLIFWFEHLKPVVFDEDAWDHLVPR